MVSFEEVAQIVAQILEIEIKDINLNSSFDRLGVDSMEMAEIFIKTEDTFNLDIPDEDEHLFKTVRDLFDYLNQKVCPQKSLE
jgi:acyl carrier protein